MQYEPKSQHSKPNNQFQTVDAVKQELDRLKPALEEAVSALKNQTQQENTNAVSPSSPLVFQVGIVVSDKKLKRQIDFISWARTIGMRAVALGKRYVGVSFELSEQRNRLYLFFVKTEEAVELPKGRSGLDQKKRQLFERLKEATTD